jgi:hypothetical protein
VEALSGDQPCLERLEHGVTFAALDLHCKFIRCLELVLR